MAWTSTSSSWSSRAWCSGSASRAAEMFDPGRLGGGELGLGRLEAGLGPLVDPHEAGAHDVGAPRREADPVEDLLLAGERGGQLALPRTGAEARGLALGLEHLLVGLRAAPPRHRTRPAGGSSDCLGGDGLGAGEVEPGQSGHRAAALGLHAGFESGDLAVQADDLGGQGLGGGVGHLLGRFGVLDGVHQHPDGLEVEGGELGDAGVERRQLGLEARDLVDVGPAGRGRRRRPTRSTGRRSAGGAPRCLVELTGRCRRPSPAGRGGPRSCRGGADGPRPARGAAPSGALRRQVVDGSVGRVDGRLGAVPPPHREDRRGARSGRPRCADRATPGWPRPGAASPRGPRPCRCRAARSRRRRPRRSGPGGHGPVHPGPAPPTATGGDRGPRARRVRGRAGAAAWSLRRPTGCPG